jgi:MFS family permease
MNKQRLFVASCLSLVVTAMIFALRGNVEDLVKNDPALASFFPAATASGDYGWLSTMAFFGFAFSILVTSPMLDALGMRNLLYLAFALHLVGIIGFIFAPSYSVMSLTMLLAGFGNGLVEAVINPLIATLYPEEKTHKLNYWRVTRLCHVANECRLETATGHDYCSDDYLWHSYFWAEISFDRARGGGHFHRCND